MGRRGQYETACALLRAFVAQGTWRQAELAKELKLSTQVLRKNLDALSEGGMPLERSEETPNVFWSVPKGWLPGGLAIEPAELPVLTEAQGAVMPTKPASAPFNDMDKSGFLK